MREERLQVEAGDLGEQFGDAGEADALEAIVGVQPPQAFEKQLVAEFDPQHVPEHEGLAIAHRLRCRRAARGELGQREIGFLGDIIAIARQHVLAVFGAAAVHFAEQVVGQIGRQPFAPVAAFVVWINAVAPPVVQQFMGVGRFEDEGETDHPGAEQGERGHAVAGFPEVLHQRELGEGIFAEQGLVKLQIAFGGVEIADRQIGIGRAQVGQGFDVAGHLRILGELRGDQMDFLHRVGAAPAVGAVAVALAYDEPVPGAIGECHAQVETDQVVAEVGNPVARLAQINAAGVDDARGLGETLRVFGALLRHVLGDAAAIADGEAAVGAGFDLIGGGRRDFAAHGVEQNAGG